MHLRFIVEPVQISYLHFILSIFFYFKLKNLGVQHDHFVSTDSIERRCRPPSNKKKNRQYSLSSKSLHFVKKAGSQRSDLICHLSSLNDSRRPCRNSDKRNSESEEVQYPTFRFTYLVRVSRKVNSRKN